MPSLTDIFRLIAHILGMGLHLFLGILLVSKRHAVTADRLALGAVVCSGLWHLTTAAAGYQKFLVLQPDTDLEIRLQAFALGALLFAATFLFHLVLVWTGLRPLWGALAYVGPVLALWASERPAVIRLCLGGMLLASIAVSLRTARLQELATYRRFHTLLAFALGLVVLASSVAAESALPAFASLLPVALPVYFIYRYNFLGILIGRRTVLVITLAVVSVVYLVFVRWIGEKLALRDDVFAGLIELSALFAAGIVWLPLFEWMTRKISRRTQVYLEYAKQIIEKADSILELADRVQFLAEQTGKLFGFRRVMLMTTQEPRLLGAHGFDVNPEATAGFRVLEGYLKGSKAGFLHVRRTPDIEIRKCLSGSGFSYVYALRHQEHLVGLFLVDIAPRIYLDEQEPILLNLSREMSHSIESCRLVEDKIRLEKALLRQEHLASLGKVAATIAHEVKNPLSSIKTLAQLMGEDPLVSENYCRDIRFIVSETDRLAGSVSQLLSFSRPAAEPKAEVPVYDLLETTVNTLAREHAGRGVRIQTSLDEGLRWLMVDRQNLQQIVLNLVLNAVQASESGGTVRVSASAGTEGVVAIEVTDEGPGIPEPVQSHIFEPFFTTKKQGTGLGLAIVKKNLQQLGGTVKVSSPVTDGRGTAFEVTLPAAGRGEPRA